MAQAWHIAALSKADPKRFPGLQQFLQPRAKATVLSHAEADAMRERSAEAIARVKALEQKRAARG